MKRLSNCIVAIVTLLASFLSLTNIASAANKNIQINSDIEARVVFGDRTEENGEGKVEVIGAADTNFMVGASGTSGNVDESMLKYVSCCR